MQEMFSFDNANLNCIQVDDESASYPSCGGFPLIGWCKDTWSSYSESCDLVLMNLESLSIKLYPNPVTDKLTVSSSLNSNLIIHFYDITGKKLIRTETNYQKVSEVNLSKFNPGVYIMRINTLNKGFTKKIIKK